MLKKLYTFFRSVKLAVVLIAWLLIMALITGIFGDLRLLFGGIGGTVPIVVPLVLFIINLVLCAISRIVGLVKSGVYLSDRGLLKLGPDLVHGAILLFLIGGLMSYYGRVEGVVTLKPGDAAFLNQEYSLELVDFRMDYYTDGTVRRYISEVLLYRGVDPLGDMMEIMVNHPLSIGRLKIYQTGYEEFETGLKAAVLQAVYDPGYPPIVWGALLAVLGLAMIAADRLRKIYLRKE